MLREQLYILRLPNALIERSTTLVQLLGGELDLPRAAAHQLLPFFEFKNDEQRFVTALLRRKPNLWVYRSHQARFCGDFLVVDMSSPLPEGRSIWGLDLKQGSRLRVGGGGAGVQFRNIGAAVQQLALREGIVPQDTGYELLSGNADEVLEFFHARRERCRQRRRRSAGSGNGTAAWRQAPEAAGLDCRPRGPGWIPSWTGPLVQPEAQAS